jgi:glycosyltransferase involved in cell wall biosynthesis
LHDPADFEVVVVDDGSEAPLNGIIDSFQDRLDLTLLVQAHAGAGVGRNTGAAQAKGRYLIFIDDDCAVHPDFLQTLAPHVRESADGMIGGGILNALPDNLYSTASYLLLCFALNYYNSPLQSVLLVSGNMTVSRDHFQAIGGFDPVFSQGLGAEERELCDRWRVSGYPMQYAPDVLVSHKHALDWRTFIQQHVKNGRGAYYFHRIRARRNERMKIEPVHSFYLHLLKYPFARGYGIKAPVLTLLLLFAQAANGAGYFLESWRDTRRVNRDKR